MTNQRRISPPPDSPTQKSRSRSRSRSRSHSPTKKTLSEKNSKSKGSKKKKSKSRRSRIEEPEVDNEADTGDTGYRNGSIHREVRPVRFVTNRSLRSGLFDQRLIYPPKYNQMSSKTYLRT